MNILYVLFETIADLLLLLVIFNALKMINGNINKPTIGEQIFSCVFICIIGIISYSTTFSQEYIVQLMLFGINQTKFLIVALAVHKRPKIKISCIVLIIQFFCELISYSIQSITAYEFKEQFMFYSVLILALTRSALLILFIFINRNIRMKHIGEVLKLLPNHIFILITLTCFFTSGLIHTADFNTPNITLKIQILKLLSLSVTFCLIAILISLLANVMLKKHYSDMNELLEKQVQIQINHYEKREKINTEIRKFKHDYTNHIGCIKSLLKAEKYAEVSEYLNNISAIFPADQFLFNTGNFISDAILSDKQESVKEDKINISFSGTIPSFINNTDLCTILSNAVDNAIEACAAVENEKNIEIFGGYKQGYFILSVKNPTLNNVNNKNIPQTTKPDKLYHGFGLQNIKDVVKKYNGVMKIENTDNCFILNLTLNIVK